MFHCAALVVRAISGRGRTAVTHWRVQRAGAHHTLLEVRLEDHLQLPDAFVIRIADPGLKLVDSLPFEVGKQVLAHGMMPILERLVTLGSNALETFTPPAMGGDMNLAEAKRRIGDKVCFIGGFDQNRFFTTATPDETRAEVRRCFNEAGQGGGFILSPSDHFFEAKPELLHAFADEARKCTYN